MSATTPQARPGALQSVIHNALRDLVAAAEQSFGDDLISIVLFGSGAENRLRLTSDLNLLIVLRQFRRERADAFSAALHVAQVSVRAAAMFALETELPQAVELFAVKFADIARRHRVLFGELPAAIRSISPEAKRRQVRETLMNLALRLRRYYLAASPNGERLPLVVAGSAGPLRAVAAALLELQGIPVESPKAALHAVVSALEAGRWLATLAQISAARETGRLPEGTAGDVLFQIMALVAALREHAETVCAARDADLCERENPA